MPVLHRRPRFWTLLLVSLAILSPLAAQPTARESLGGQKARTVTELALGAGGRIWAATRTAGLFRSDDGAERWSRVERNPLPGLPGAGPGSKWTCGEILALAASPTDPDIAYAANRHGVMKTTDGGATWEPTGSFQSIEAIALSPGDPEVLYISNHRQVWRTDDGGGTWHAARGLAAGVSVHGLTVDPAVPLTVYAATDQGSYRSTDGGLNWVRGMGLASAELVRIVIDPDDPVLLYAIERFENLWKSEDQGLTWTLLANLKGHPTLTDLEIDPFSPGTLYLTANGTDIKPMGRVLRSLDRGETWAPMLTTDGIHDLEFDPQQPGRIYAADSALGVFRSEDFGATWTPANKGLAVTDVQVFTKRDGEVCFRVEDSTVTIIITPINDAPVASNDAYSVAEGGTLTQPAPGVLNGDTDPEGDPLTAVLDSGPSHISSFTLNADGSFTYVHDRSETLTDSFTYHANDGSADSNVATVTITITPVNDAPMLDLDADDSGGTAGTDFAITFADGDPTRFIEDPADATITDADSATLTTLTVTLTNLLDAGSEILDVDLTGADLAFSKSYDNATDPSQGVLTITASPARPTAELVALLRKVTYINTDDHPDATARIIQFVANDGTSNSNAATTTVTMTAVNDAPVADNNSYSVDEGGTLTQPAPGVLDGDTDPDGDTLTAVLDSGPANGTLTLNANGSFTYVHNGGETTTDSFTYHANDGTANSNVATVTITITAVNDAPTATNDAYTVAEGGTLTQPAPGVLSNDTDPEGSALTAVLDSGPAHAASFTLNANGSFTYTHNGSETPLTDSFTYHANDGTANSNVVTVTITITPVNDAPVADNDAYSVNEGGTLTQPAAGVLDGDTDAEGSALTAVLDSGPANGTLTLNANGSFTYTHNGSETLTDSFTYHANDGSANSNVATVTITINPVDGPPTAVADAATVDEDSGANAINVLANDTDPDAGPISISAVTQPTNGTVVITGGGTGLTYAPNLNYCNLPPGTTPDTFTYTLAPGGSSTTVSVAVTCINDPPVADNDAFDFIGNTELRVDLAAATTPHALETTGTGFGVLDGDSDPVENNPISIVQLTVGACVDNSAPFNCTAAGIGTVNLEANGRFSFIPEAGDTSATETFSYTISDGQPVNATATATVTLTRFERVWYVKNDAPAGGLGRSSDPFDTLAEAQTASLANDYIFVYFGTGTTTGHTAGIALKNGQHLIGEHAGLSLPVSLNGNGAPTNLVAAAPGNRPLLNDTVADAIEGVSAVNAMPAEIVGLNLAGNVNAIDWNTNSAFAGMGAFSIRDNVIRSAAGDGVDINLAGTSAVSLAFHDNLLTATGIGLDIRETGTGSLTITRFDDNVVSGNTGGTGININTATFDATPGGGINPVNGGFTLIGALGNGVGGSGLLLSTVTGTLSFTDLDIVADGGTGLSLSGTGVATTNLTVGTGVSTIEATGGPAVNASSATVDLQLTSLRSTNSSASGVSLSTVNGTFSAGSGSSITNASSTDFVVSGGTADITYAGTITDDLGLLVSVSNATAGTKSFTGAITDGDDGDGSGISLASNTGATISFSGGVTLSTGTSPAFRATGGGTVRVTGSTNKLTTTTGLPLNVANTTIHADGLTFRSISSNGSANGIFLNNTGTLGGLTVSGTGAAGTGGTVQNTTSHAVSIANTRAVTLHSMNILDAGGNGVSGNDVASFTLHNSRIERAGSHGLSFVDSGAADIDLTVSGSTVSANQLNGFLAIFNDAVQHAVTLTGSTFTGNNIGVQLTSAASADLDFEIASNTFLDQISHAILIQPNSNTTNAAQVVGTIASNAIGNGTADSGSRDGYGIRLDMQGDATATVAVTGNTVRNTDLEGIFVESRLDSDADAEVGHLDLTLRDNDAGQPDDNSATPVGNVYGTRVEARNTTVLCLDIAGNDAENVGAFEDIRLRQLNTSTFRLERFTGNGAVDTDVETFLTGQNPLIDNADATHSTTFTGVANGFCAKP